MEVSTTLSLDHHFTLVVSGIYIAFDEFEETEGGSIYLLKKGDRVAYLESIKSKEFMSALNKVK